MAELEPSPPRVALDLPFTAGAATLAALPEAAMLEVLPFRGRAAEVGAALGVPLPGPGRVAAAPGGGALIWAGLDRWLLRGPAEARLEGIAAAIDQSDGWVGLALGGAAAREALARLVPLDLAAAAFPEGSAARTGLRHVPCLLLAVAEGFEILVPRSYAGVAVAEIAEAMRAVAARAAIG